TANVDVAVVGVAAEAVTAPFQFLVEIINLPLALSTLSTTVRQKRPPPLHRRQICLAAHRLKQPGLCSTGACNVCSIGAAFAQPAPSSVANAQKVSNLSI